MTLKEAGAYLVEQLELVYDSSEANAIADLVLENMTGLNRSQRSLESTKPFNIKSRLQELINQLQTHRPVQYVLNEAWFYGLKFQVNESVLIPRPETEELVDWIVKDVRSTKYEVRSVSPPLTIHHSPLTIFDIGTGSGCIPIALKKNLPQTEVYALDVCTEALHTAINNAVTHETEINFQLLDFLDEGKWNDLGKYDIIVSNPPYIKTTDANTMSKHVLEFEPHKALFVPDEDALLFYRKIADFALHHLNSNGDVYVEINQQLGKETVELFQQKGFTVELKKDMSGNERMVKATVN